MRVHIRLASLLLSDYLFSVLVGCRFFPAPHFVYQNEWENLGIPGSMSLGKCRIAVKFAAYMFNAGRIGKIYPETCCMGDKGKMPPVHTGQGALKKGLVLSLIGIKLIYPLGW